MDSPEAPVDMPPNDSNQIFVNESVVAEYERRSNKRVVLAAAMFFGVLAVSGCNSQDVGANDSAPVQPSTSEVTPSAEPDEPTKFELARDALRHFQPDTMPDLEEFSNNPDRVQAREDAERYLEGKDAKLALVNYSSSSPEELEQLASTLEESLPAITASTFTVDVEVVQASPVAKRLYTSHNPNNEFNPEDDKNYGSVIAAAIMPNINDFDSVIALTDTQFGTADDSKNGQTLVGGKYADVTSVAETKPLTLANEVIHEYLHAVPRLHHAKTVMGEMGDFASAFPHDPAAEQRANLEEFLKTAWVDEYGMENVMGDVSRLFDTPPLTRTQLDVLGSAERMLDKDYIVERTKLNSDITSVAYNQESSENAIAVYTLDEMLGMRGRDDQGINGVIDLTFTPHYFDGTWNISVDGDTLDKGQVNFMNMYISQDPSQGHAQQTIDLPGGKTIRASITDSNGLLITAQ
jgi:hypothetical protein